MYVFVYAKCKGHFEKDIELIIFLKNISHACFGRFSLIHSKVYTTYIICTSCYLHLNEIQFAILFIFVVYMHFLELLRIGAIQ